MYSDTLSGGPLSLAEAPGGQLPLSLREARSAEGGQPGGLRAERSDNGSKLLCFFLVSIHAGENFLRSPVAKRCMRPLLVVKLKISIQAMVQLMSVFIVFQVDILVLYAAP